MGGAGLTATEVFLLFSSDLFVDLDGILPMPTRALSEVESKTTASDRMRDSSARKRNVFFLFLRVDCGGEKKVQN